MTLLRQTWLFACLVCISLLGGCATPEQAAVPLIREVDQQTLWRGSGSATDYPIPGDRQTLHVKDPYLWVYNASFAKDFGMPEKWVDNTLSGADALAFRTTASFPMCGWGGNPKACRVSSQCVLEVYFHHDRHPLPWNEALRWTDAWLRETSVNMMYSLRPLDRIDSLNWPKAPLIDPKTRTELKWWNVHPSKNRSGGGARLLAYDRSLFDSYALLVLNYDCLPKDLAGLTLASKPSHYPSIKVHHAITFPSSWREKLRLLIKKVAEEDQFFFHSQFKKLDQSR